MSKSEKKAKTERTEQSFGNKDSRPKYDILYRRAAQFNFFECNVGRYTYDKVAEPEIQKFLEQNPIETFIDMEDE